MCYTLQLFAGHVLKIGNSSTFQKECIQNKNELKIKYLSYAIN
jgi:hypothetical protein